VECVDVHEICSIVRNVADRFTLGDIRPAIRERIMAAMVYASSIWAVEGCIGQR